MFDLVDYIMKTKNLYEQNAAGNIPNYESPETGEDKDEEKKEDKKVVRVLVSRIKDNLEKTEKTATKTGDILTQQTTPPPQ